MPPPACSCCSCSLQQWWPHRACRRASWW
jgi:hypothetical protein